MKRVLSSWRLKLNQNSKNSSKPPSTDQKANPYLTPTSEK
ncbi:DUF6444 domain-containing protein [Neochlamydia sp. S13]